MKTSNISALILTAITLTACGGGGSSSAPPAPPVNAPPTADAGADQAVDEGATVQLSGMGTDPEGTTLTYAWSQVSGPTVTLSSTSDPSASFLAPDVPVRNMDPVVLSLRVTDTAGEANTDQVTIDIASTDFLLVYGDLFVNDEVDLHRYDPDSDTFTNISNMPASSRISGFVVSPDKQWVVYQTTRQGGHQLDLSPLDGTTFTEISPPSAIPGVFYREFLWSPDGSRIAYVANAEIAGATEVFLVDRDGSNPQKISGTVGSPPRVDLERIQWSPDGRYVAQLVRSKSSGLVIGINTHDTQAGGPNSVRLNPTVVPGGAIFRFSWAPDSSRILYQGLQDFDDRVELYTVRPDGSDHQKVSVDLLPDGIASQAQWSSDSTKILYKADPDELGQSEVFVVNPDGTGNVRINGPLNAGQISVSLAWSPDGARVSYVSNEEGAPDTFDLYTSSPDGMNTTKVSVPLVAGGGPRYPAWSPDGSRIAYYGASVDTDVMELYTVRPDGTESLKVSGSMVAGGSVYLIPGLVYPPRWSPDSSRLLYSADQETDGVIELFTVRTDASENFKLNAPIGQTGVVGDFRDDWSADSSAVAYYTDLEIAGMRELYIASADGVFIDKVALPLPVGGSVVSASWVK